MLAALAGAAKDHRIDKTRPPTPTGTFLLTQPAPDAIALHLIERRGHYFHNNPTKPKAWQPDKQDEARDLAWLCIGINNELSTDYAAPIFDDSLSPRHFDEALRSGAILMLKIDYTYEQDGDGEARIGRFNVNIPGTKPTRAVATETARIFLEHFTEQLPAAGLHHAICRRVDTDEPLFEFRVPKELP